VDPPPPSPLVVDVVDVVVIVVSVVPDVGVVVGVILLLVMAVFDVAGIVEVKMDFDLELDEGGSKKDGSLKDIREDMIFFFFTFF